jgi:hypothetical protein
VETKDATQPCHRVVVATKETIRLMSEVDKAIPKWPVT